MYEIVDTLYAQFDAETADLMATVAEKGTTLDDVVILASFIQEEAGVPEEDYKVSACFHNRLESDDPLWSSHMLESNACSYITQDVENNYLWNSPTANIWAGRRPAPSRRMCSTPMTPTASAACRPGRSPTRALRPLTPRSTRTRSSWPKATTSL